MEIPDAMVETQQRQTIDEFGQRLQMQGLNLEQYFQFTGLTYEHMMEQVKPQAERRIKSRLVLEAVAAAENIEATEEDFDAEVKRMAEGYKMEADKIKELMGEQGKKQIMEDLAQPYVQGLTLLGGEPFLNTGILLPLVKRIRKELPEKDIWSWTGYTWEEMMLETPDKLELLSLIDILIDGRYDKSKRNLMLQFRGSSNQRIIDVQKSLKEGKVVIWDKLNDGKESFEQVKRDDLL
mgnify:CR=1 FL=1